MKGEPRKKSRPVVFTLHTRRYWKENSYQTIKCAEVGKLATLPWTTV
jgi:hypothetical protein